MIVRQSKKFSKIVWRTTIENTVIDKLRNLLNLSDSFVKFAYSKIIKLN